MPTQLKEAMAELMSEFKPGTIDGEYTTVRVVNTGDKLLPMEWNSRKYHLKPGGINYVPYDCMKYWCGDPRAFDVPNGRPHERFRTNEWARLRILYGIYENTSDVQLMTSNLPSIEVYTPSGLRIPTVLDDPEGLTMDEFANQVSELDSAKSEIELLRNELAKAMARMDGIENKNKPADPMLIRELDEDRRTDAPLVTPIPSTIPEDPKDLVINAEDLNPTQPPPTASLIPTKKASTSA